MSDISESSSSDDSPTRGMANLEDLSMDQDVDVKKLKQELYDLKLRIYYMEEREKMMKTGDGDDIIQKYLLLQSEYEQLQKTLDEKDELLVKAEKITTYLREEKEKMQTTFQSREVHLQERVLSLQKELENMKLTNPKFGLQQGLMSGDGADSFSFMAAKDLSKITELEQQVQSLNLDMESYRANNEQLEHTIATLQRKINMSNKEINDLTNELTVVKRERDNAVEINHIKTSQILEDKKKEGEYNQESNEKSNDANLTEPVQSPLLSDKTTTALIRRLLTENKKMNRQLLRLKDDQLVTYELCSGCPHCQKERKLKKAKILNLQPKSGGGHASESERSDTPGSRVTSDSESEPPNYESLCRLKDKTELCIMLREKDKHIKQLRAECRRRDYNLQELVNKELWDKNREIEKLNRSCEKHKQESEQLRRLQSHSDYVSSPMREIQHSNLGLSPRINSGGSTLNLSFKDGKENQNSQCLPDEVKVLREELRKCLDEKKNMLNKIALLESRITNDEEHKALSALVRNLRLEVSKHREDYVEAERAREDVFNACAMLTARLEELATFLESLLTYDNASLNVKKRELLRQAIDRSREISKSFSSTFADPDNASNVATRFASSVDLSAPILPDYSEINLSFSCGDDDDDEQIIEIAGSSGSNAGVNRTLVFDDDEDNAQLQHRNEDTCRNSSVFNQMMQRSMDFANSTEDSDSYALRKNTNNGNFMFVNNLNRSGEMIFSAQGVRQMVGPNGGNVFNDRKSDDTESELWSGQEHHVRCGITTASGTKLRNKKWRPEPCYTTDSDVSVRTSRRCVDVEEVRLMQRRIHHLERFNESLRKDLKYHKSRSSENRHSEKTDREKVLHQSKIRSILSSVDLEGHVDAEKYQQYVDLVQKLEGDLAEAHVRITQLEARNCDLNNCNQLQASLNAASKRIVDLESFVAANDQTLDELERCKKTILELTAQNEKLLGEIDDVSKYRVRIDEYENQIATYKENCRKLEVELYTKDTMEKLYKEQCDKLEKEIAAKNSLTNTLRLTEEELCECRAKVAQFESQVNDLEVMVREKENAILEHDCRLLELKTEKENNTLMLNQLKEKTQKEIEQKQKNVDELTELLKISDEKTVKFEKELQVLKGLLQVCETEKRDYKTKIEEQLTQYQTLKSQHEQKMRHLLAQIIVYKTEEENSLAAHRQLIEQIEEAQKKKEVWKKTIADWKQKYDILKAEHDQMEAKLNHCPNTSAHSPNKSNVDKDLTSLEVEQDWFVREAELRYQLDVATMTTSHVILEWTRLANEKLRLQRELHHRDKPHYVRHLHNVKSQLETRVMELETANKELECRLRRLQTSSNKMFNCGDDCDLSFNDDSSRAASPAVSPPKANFDDDEGEDESSSAYKSGPGSGCGANTSTTGYSSSFPSSPNHDPHSSNDNLLNLTQQQSLDNGGNENWSTSVAADAEAKNELNNISTIQNNFSVKNNSVHSPDLGIESDPGHNSSFELNICSTSANNYDNNNGILNDKRVVTEIVHLEEENKSLKEELCQMRKELEETLEKLTVLNKNKKRMKKAIYKQFYETKNILKQAREHLEDGVNEPVDS